MSFLSPLLSLALAPLVFAAETAPGTFPETESNQASKEYDDAVAAGKWDTAVVALVTRLRAAESKKDEGEGDYLRALDKACATAPAPMRPILRAVTANAYKSYMENHGWQIAQRTAGGSGDKIEGWDGPRFVKETDTRLQAALADEKALLAVPIGAFAAITDKPASSPGDVAAPTLYDFIARRAFEQYVDLGSGRYASGGEDTPASGTGSPWFDDTEAFLNRKLQGTSPLDRAAVIVQRLMKIHADEPEAFAAAELLRLSQSRLLATDDVTRAGIVRRFLTLADNRPTTFAAPYALANAADIRRDAGDLIGAHAHASRGAKMRPGSSGAAVCANLVSQIEAPSLNIDNERVWNTPLPRISVRHKNVGKVHFRLVKWDWSVFLKREHGRPEALSAAERAAIIAAKPEREWSSDLPPTKDFEETETRLRAPDDVKPGFHFLLASTDPTFAAGNAPVLCTDLWVSDLAIVAEGAPGEVRGRVCDARTGEPLGGVIVSGWTLQNNRDRVPTHDAVTGPDGVFSIQTPRQRGVLLLAKGPTGDELAAMNEIWTGVAPRDPKPKNIVHFFTDRGIYRPGQTLKFKGVVVRDDPVGLKPHVLSGRRTTVVLDDANGKEIARRECVTNEYGAFIGEFVVPKDRLPGTYALHTVGSENGRAYPRVEEYKRPTFEVTLDEAKSGATPRGRVVTGKAAMYEGAPVDGAKVSWHVTRMTAVPYWCGWWQPAQDTRVAQGESVTDAKGAFKIAFDATKPEGEPPGYGITHFYAVTCDITDAAGETRSDTRTVIIGEVDRYATVEHFDPKGEIGVMVRGYDGGKPAPEVEGKVVVRRLIEPRVVHRKKLEEGRFVRPFRVRHDNDVAQASVEQDEDLLSDPVNWQAGDIVATLPFKTGKTGEATVTMKTEPGHYRAFVETVDSAGKPVTARAELRILPESGDRLGLKIPFFAEHPESRDYAPGDTALIRWGSGYDTARAYVEIERRDKPPERFWTKPGVTLADIRVPVTEADRGGLSVSVSEIRDNRFYSETFPVSVPWSDKKLKIVWKHFTDKMKPGARETWTAIVTGPDDKPAPAEVVATLYDASLDAYQQLNWAEHFGVWPDFVSRRSGETFLNASRRANTVQGEWPETAVAIPDQARKWAPKLEEEFMVFKAKVFAKRSVAGGAPMEAAAALSSAAVSDGREFGGAPSARTSWSGDAKSVDGSGAAPKEPDLVAPRKNLNETAFFIPRATTGDNGAATFTFTVPESLTRWRFLAFAHDKGLRTGMLEDSAVTSLDLMARPNAPRFLREGDAADMPVKLINRTDKPVTGTARLELEDATTHRKIDAELKNAGVEKPFTIPANGSVALAWRIVIPDGCGPVAYTVRASAASGDSDGETGVVPVLPRRVPVVESVAASLAGPGETTLRLPNLAGSGSSDTLRSTQLRVDTVSRPAWYAVMALPYLMKFPHECSEQLFNRYYANALAAHIANSDPRMRAVFDAWKNTPALDSPLEKDEDLKQLALEETPWVAEAESESAQRRRVGVLFDKARLDSEAKRILEKLEQRRTSDGGWPWFPGGESSPWISRTVALGVGRLRAMGVPTYAGLALRAIASIDADVVSQHAAILKSRNNPDAYRLPADAAHTLHARSYFLNEAPIPENAKEAYAFFLKHAKSDWSWLDRASQARLAIALPAFGDTDTPALVVKSLRERAVTGGDKGMRWNDAPNPGFVWWRPWVAPVETQAMMVEVFETVAKDPAAADACRLALLADKRTNAWDTTTATADACYALLMRGGANLLSGEGACAVTVAGKTLTPETIEAGTGAATVRVPVAEITPKSADIVVKKPEAGPAWIAVHWSYLEDAAKVKPANQGALNVVKTLWKKTRDAQGVRLTPITADSPVRVGDEVVVRLEVTNDRDLQFVHIKDTRPSCLEPGIALSGYKWSSELGYYEAVRDTATHRFVESMPKGTHVFEFSARADRKGVCGAGLSEVRCMYAPEFAAHAGAPELRVE